MDKCRGQSRYKVLNKILISISRNFDTFIIALQYVHNTVNGEFSTAGKFCGIFVYWRKFHGVAL